MSVYRLCIVSANGEVSRALDLECLHDEAAVESASRHEAGLAMELWDHQRLVRRFAPGRRGARTPNS